MWSSGQCKAAKVKHSGTTRQREFCGEDFILSLGGGCTPIARCLRGVGFVVCLGIFDLVCFFFFRDLLPRKYLCALVHVFFVIELCFTAAFNYCGCFRLSES